MVPTKEPMRTGRPAPEETIATRPPLRTIRYIANMMRKEQVTRPKHRPLYILFEIVCTFE
jgi:hypothetical protein